MFGCVVCVHVCIYTSLNLYNLQGIIHTQTHTYIHTYIQTYIHTYIHTCMHTYKCIHTYVCTYLHSTHIHTHIVTIQLLFQHCYWFWRGQYLGVQVHVCQRQGIMCPCQWEQLLSLHLPAQLPHTPSHCTLEVCTAGVWLCGCERDKMLY